MAGMSNKKSKKSKVKGKKYGKSKRLKGKEYRRKNSGKKFLTADFAD